LPRAAISTSREWAAIDEVAPLLHVIDAFDLAGRDLIGEPQRAAPATMTTR
jgi:hypothetical protein